MKTILITGGAGFIGSHTAVELIQAGYEVIVADNLSNADTTILEGVEKITRKKIPFHKVDCCDKRQLKERFLKRHAMTEPFIFAGIRPLGKSVVQAANVLSQQPDFFHDFT